MNMYDFSNINRIFDEYESQIPGIKIVDGSKSSRAVSEFKNDLKKCNSFDEVDRVLLQNENLVGIQLKSNATPIVYYFINNFDGVGEVLVEFRRVCDDLNITFQEMC